MTRAWQCLPQNDAAQEAEYPGVGQGVPREGNEEGIFFFFLALQERKVNEVDERKGCVYPSFYPSQAVWSCTCYLILFLPLEIEENNGT